MWLEGRVFSQNLSLCAALPFLHVLTFEVSATPHHLGAESPKWKTMEESGVGLK